MLIPFFEIQIFKFNLDMPHFCSIFRLFQSPTFFIYKMQNVKLLENESKTTKQKLVLIKSAKLFERKFLL